MKPRGVKMRHFPGTIRKADQIALADGKGPLGHLGKVYRRILRMGERARLKEQVAKEIKKL